MIISREKIKALRYHVIYNEPLTILYDGHYVNP